MMIYILDNMNNYERRQKEISMTFCTFSRSHFAS